jgi:hypothetical protein
LPVTPGDAGQAELRASEVSALDAPYSLEFEWSVTEPGMRVRGRGVARVEPPYRARLDLFTGAGERIAAAALVNDHLRVPPGMPDVLPPPALLWGALGVFRPGDPVDLLGGRRHGDGATELRYSLPGDEELRYVLRGFRIPEMELRRNGRAREELRLVQADGDRFPREAVYRQLEQVRELKITLERVDHAESYHPSIWTPGS